MTRRLATITGAASGIGFAPTTELLEHAFDWHRHALVDACTPPISLKEMP